MSDVVTGASLLIGAHGAGLVNALAMRPGGAVSCTPEPSSAVSHRRIVGRMSLQVVELLETRDPIDNWVNSLGQAPCGFSQFW